MKGAVDPILGEVGQHQHGEKLDGQGKRTQHREPSRVKQ